jgi:hypothetical protein
MTDVNLGLTIRPDHVPPELVVDFNLFESARKEPQIFLPEWLRWLPDYEIAPGTRSKTTMGTLACLSELHLIRPTAG